MFKIIGGDGRQYGPVSAEQIRQWMAEGRASAQTMAQAEGSTEWKPLGQFPEFAPSTPPPLGATPSPTPPPPSAAPAAPRFQPHEHIDSYLVPAILSTICCCLPFGIVSIIFAAQVNTKLQTGDIQGAREASRNAKIWFWVAVACGLMSVCLWVPFMHFRLHRFHPGW
ncbi:MAG TPA: CD225/dispanin family protein [Verrucomicrobiae bacterium]|nr:CD225/dispanin family protein [Verrucomicrobiae bacterium]